MCRKPSLSLVLVWDHPSQHFSIRGASWVGGPSHGAAPLHAGFLHPRACLCKDHGFQPLPNLHSVEIRCCARTLGQATLVALPTGVAQPPTRAGKCLQFVQMNEQIAIFIITTRSGPRVSHLPTPRPKTLFPLGCPLSAEELMLLHCGVGEDS